MSEKIDDARTKQLGEVLLENGVITDDQLKIALHEQKVTILLVEQNVNQALKIAHYAYVLKTGKIVMRGSGEELFSNEEIRKVYIGGMAVTGQKK